MIEAIRVVHLRTATERRMRIFEDPKRRGMRPKVSDARCPRTLFLYSIGTHVYQAMVSKRKKRLSPEAPWED
jgi:hypothetical protein